MLRVKDEILIKGASYLSVLTAIAILLIKVYGWFVTESQSLLASLVDTILDISSSSINLIALLISLKPPDNNHRFGHEKFQDLAIFSQAIFFFASSLFTLSSAVKALLNHSIVENTDIGVEMMYICVVLTFILISYQWYVVKRTKSRLIAMDMMHYSSDLVTNFVVIGCISFSTKEMWYIDPIFGIFISLYIAFNSLKFFKQAIRNLADEEFSQEDKQKILDIIGKHSSIIGVHELKTRYAANKPFIQCHLEMEGNTSLFEAYIVKNRICAEILLLFHGGEVTICQEPTGSHKKAHYYEHIKHI